jgi:hypothetical protein
MRHKRRMMFMLCISCCILACAQTAISWSVNPAKWTLYHREDYEIGSETPYEWPLEIKNDGDTPITVNIIAKKPEYLYEGFSELPDLYWVKIKDKTLTVSANETKQTMISINIENASEHYNQSYEFWIFVDQVEGSGNIQTDYNCRWMIITPKEYVPLEKRAGYIHWPTIGLIVLGGIAGVSGLFVWAKNSKKKQIPKNGAQAKHEKAKEKLKEDSKNTIKFQRS